MRQLLLIGSLTVFMALGGLMLSCSDDGEETNTTNTTTNNTNTTNTNNTNTNNTNTNNTNTNNTNVCDLDADADKVKIGGIFTITSGGSASTQAANKDQIDMIASEINKGCGLIGDGGKGAAVEVVFKDGQDDSSITPGLTTDLINEKVAFMVGAGGSSPTTASVKAMIEGTHVPYGIYFGTGDAMNGCTAAQLADDGVTKSPTPIFEEGKCWDHKGMVFRTSTLSTTWGKTIGKYVNEKLTDAKKAVVIYRNDGFGTPIKDLFEATFTEAGGEVNLSQGYEKDSNKEAFKDIIKDAAFGDPDVVVGVFRIGELKSFIEAYVELSEDASWTKPANYDKIQFVWGGSVRSDYTAVSAAAITAMKDRSVGLQPYWAPNSDSYKAWEAAFADYDPSYKVVAHTQMRTYDALMILALATVKANSTDAEKIAAEIANVSNPPGDVILPGEFAKARKLLFESKDINYEGASGSVDVQDGGSIEKTPYQIWGVTDDGSSEFKEAYDSAE